MIKTVNIVAYTNDPEEGVEVIIDCNITLDDEKMFYLNDAFAEVKSQVKRQYEENGKTVVSVEWERSVFSDEVLLVTYLGEDHSDEYDDYEVDSVYTEILYPVNIDITGTNAKKE